MNLFDHTTFGCSKLVTQAYSTSFSLGIRTLDKRFHAPIYAIYGFVRYADEIVDTFHDHDKALLLQEFKEQTFESISRNISLNPILHSFQHVVNHYQIDHGLIHAFLDSMEMDLYQTDYTQAGYQKYIYGSAEVVGLMCLCVFCDGDQNLYDRLVDPARSLGAAFQKVNFLRDIQADFEERGRTYFPNVDFTQFSIEDKLQIEADIQADFDLAFEGIVNLPEGARKGVYLAYVYYIKLFQKIKNTPASAILTKRIRIPDFKKMQLLLSSYLRLRLNTL